MLGRGEELSLSHLSAGDLFGVKGRIDPKPSGSSCEAEEGIGKLKALRNPPRVHLFTPVSLI